MMFVDDDGSILTKTVLIVIQIEVKEEKRRKAKAHCLHP